MGLQVNLASKVVISTGTTIGVRLLPDGVRTPPTYTIVAAAAGTSGTATLSAAVVKGATSLAVTALATAIPAQSKIVFTNGVVVRTTAAAAAAATTIPINPSPGDIPSGTVGTYTAGSLTLGTMFLSVAAIPIDIDAGEVLLFGANRVTVTDYTPMGATTLDVLPTTAVITAGATATTFALYQVASPLEVLPSPDIKTEDTTSMASGFGKEMVTTAIGVTLNLTFHMIDDTFSIVDRGGNEIRKTLFTVGFQGKELFVRVVRPGDGVYQGAAMVTQAPQQGGVQAKVTQQATMNLQGSSYSYIAEGAN